MLRHVDESSLTPHTAAPARDVAATEDRVVRSTEEVIQNHLARFGEQDLDGILADYAPDAVLFTREGPLRGLEQIRRLFQTLLAEFGRPGATFSLKQLTVEGDHGFIVWTAETADNVYELGTDTFYVRGGNIQVQSFAGKIASRSVVPG